MLDLLLYGGTVMDGSGYPMHRAGVGVDHGKVVLPGAASPDARRAIDASGLLVAPGILDASHADFVFFRDPRPDMKVRQGVTTEIIGKCGSSRGPLVERETAFSEPDVEKRIRVLGRSESFVGCHHKVRKLRVEQHWRAET
jgi:N-acyl-D-amino-acid deacylase